VKTLHLGYDAQRRPVRLDPDDRKTHMHVIGSSGSGKSKFLEYMIRGDINNRQGFALLDPHGTLYSDVLQFCSHRVLDRDIILLDLSSPASIIGFNPFQRAEGADVSVQVDHRIIATMHAWGVDNADQTPTLERMLRLIYTVMIEQNLGLGQVQHLIDFNAYAVRSYLVDRLKSQLIQKEWMELQQMKSREWREETLSARNRFFRFLTSPALTRFMGIPGRTLDLRQIMDEGKILLVNLAPSDQLSEENARVFGALLINEFFETARRRRKDDLGRDPKPFFLYLDEFQNFVSLDIADMLDQVRKFGLFTILAHQRFGHLDENITDAVLTNCRIKAVFGGLPAESAQLMAKELFIGKLDPKKIKVAIKQTKFWPEYRRDKVYTKGSSHGSSSGWSESSGSGYSSGMTTGEFFGPSDWLGSGSSMGTSTSRSSGDSYTSSSGSSGSDSWSDSESEADIPILIPVPFQELSSVQYYTLEEQLMELTAALKEQFPRHCFIKIRDEETQPLLVPLVEQKYTSKTSQQWYAQRLLQQHDALPAEHVDALLKEQELKLTAAAGADQGIIIDIQPQQKQPEPAEPGSSPPQTKQRKKEKKKNIFDDI
jgi:Helicase HerA, central domain/TraM recognition site of TraD and TraG